MRILDSNELSQVNGGFINFAIGAGIGLVSYAWSKDFKLDNMSLKGASLAAGAGALTGGVGGMAVKAAGGGLAGAAAWRPGFAGLNFGLQKSISRNH